MFEPDLDGVSTWFPPNQPEASSPAPPPCSPGAVHGDEDFQCLFLLASALIISTPSWLASFSSPSTGGGSLAAASNGKGAEKGWSSFGATSPWSLQASRLHILSKSWQRRSKATTQPFSSGQAGCWQLEGALKSADPSGANDQGARSSSTSWHLRVLPRLARGSAGSGRASKRGSGGGQFVSLKT